MKLRNKKTGEIRELPDGFFCGDSLKKICEEWEDYEEPKEYWYIDPDANIERTSVDAEYDDEAKQIGNYFESKEEAEQAVEKLKAWKRLKDKGFRFTQQPFDLSLHTIHFTLDGQYKYTDETSRDLHLLFGGEE